MAKLSGLAGARVVAQLLGLAWFLLAARVFDAVEFGVLSTALVLVVVIGGLSDLGTTRTVVRHAAADRAALRSSFVRAAALRGGAGLLLALTVIVAAPRVQDTVSVQLVAMAGLIAVASGITEIGFAALRSVGSVTTEARLLVGERALFVAAGTAIVLVGGGPLAVLAVYAATNLASAAVASLRTLTFPGGAGSPSGPMLDAEGRHTAVGSTLVIVGPRVSALLLVVLSTSTVVGTFSIAQKVPEALGILGAAVLLPLLPMVRSQLLDGRGERAVDDAGRITATVLMVMVPAAVLLSVDGRRVLDLLFGAGDRAGSVATLALLSAVSVLWVVRTYGEVLLLAQERAARYLAAVASGLVVNLLVGVALVGSSASTGAASAALLAEVVAVLVTFSALRTTVGASTRRLVVPVLAIGLAAGATAMAGRSLPLALNLILVGAWAAVGTVVVGLPLLEGRGRVGPTDEGSAAAGDHADVGEQLGGDLGRDGVEAVEYLAGPADHL
ncbi:MAG: lipopolysaccharide biosynthesis protein [Acidimicrobiales bacterium]|nr:lipopolysaccharide biosynthesis protein [Acidimicrobiales bacterium]